MNKWLSILLNSALSAFRTQRDLAFENLLLRQQLAVVKESGSRPHLTRADRSFWVLVSRLWPRWRMMYFDSVASETSMPNFRSSP